METEEISKKNNNKVIIIVSVLVIALVVATLYFFNFYKKPSIKLISKELTIEQGDSIDLLSNLALENVDSDKIKFNTTLNNVGVLDGTTFKSVNQGNIDVEINYEDIKLVYKIVVKEKEEPKKEDKDGNDTDINEEYIVSFYDGENLFDSIKVKNGQYLYLYSLGGSYYIEDNRYEIKKPQKDNYAFVGWSKDGEAEILNDITIKENVNLIANFVKVYTLNLVYDENYTRILEVKEEEMNNLYKTLYEGTYPLKPTNDEHRKISSLKKGYSFDGWYLDGNKITKDTKASGDNLTIVAKYIKNDDTSYLEEYKKFETDNLNADLIYELSRKTFTSGPLSHYESSYYYNNTGKTEDYSFEEKISNIMNIIFGKIKCSTYNFTIDGRTGCYISKDSLEKSYKYIYGADSYFEHKESGNIGSFFSLEFSSNKNRYFYSFPITGAPAFTTITEKVVNVVKYEDRIELTKKVMTCFKYTEATCYDYDESQKTENQIPLESTEFEEVKDKLDAYIFVFKKDSKDNYYLYEVKKEEAK